MLAVVTHAPSPEDIEAARRRRARLVAALTATGVSQSELHRRMLDAGETRLALTTINRWCTGRAVMTEMTLRAILSLLGLPADWEPPGASS